MDALGSAASLTAKKGKNACHLPTCCDQGGVFCQSSRIPHSIPLLGVRKWSPYFRGHSCLFVSRRRSSKRIPSLVSSQCSPSCELSVLVMDNLFWHASPDRGDLFMRKCTKYWQPQDGEFQCLPSNCLQCSISQKFWSLQLFPQCYYLDCWGHAGLVKWPK